MGQYYGLRSKINTERVRELERAVSRAHARGNISQARAMKLHEILATFKKEAFMVPSKKHIREIEIEESVDDLDPDAEPNAVKSAARRKKRGGE